MSKRGPTGFEALKEIGKRMNDLADVAKTALEQAEKSADGTKEFTITTGDGKPLNGVMGFSTRSVMGAANSVVNSAGDAARNAEFRPAEKADIDDAREPLIDVYDEADELVIAAELPGVAIGDLSVDLEGDTLTLKTTGAKRFLKQIQLEAAVDPASIGHSLRNGILEIRLTKLAQD